MEAKIRFKVDQNNVHYTILHMVVSDTGLIRYPANNFPDAAYPADRITGYQKQD